MGLGALHASAQLRLRRCLVCHYLSRGRPRGLGSGDPLPCNRRGPRLEAPPPVRSGLVPSKAFGSRECSARLHSYRSGARNKSVALFSRSLLSHRDRSPAPQGAFAARRLRFCVPWGPCRADAAVRPGVVSQELSRRRAERIRSLPTLRVVRRSRWTLARPVVRCRLVSHEKRRCTGSRRRAACALP
jgi:hypothetical protein